MTNFFYAILSHVPKSLHNNQKSQLQKEKQRHKLFHWQEWSLELSPLWAGGHMTGPSSKNTGNP